MVLEVPAPAAGVISEIRLQDGAKVTGGEVLAVIEEGAAAAAVPALLTITVGLVLPGMITHTATEVSEAAKRLTSGTLREFSHAMAALGRGELDAAHASVNIVPID